MIVKIEEGRRYYDTDLEIWDRARRAEIIDNTGAKVSGWALSSGQGMLKRTRLFYDGGTATVPTHTDLFEEVPDATTTVVMEDQGHLPFTEGVKYDEQKPPLHLIAPDFLYAISEILDFGARKYSARNWEKGMEWHRLYRAALGHLFDWFMRKGPDPETGKSHLWHVACCIMFLVVYEMRNVGTDDRP